MVQNALVQQRRLDSVGYPLLRSARPLCVRDASRLTGVHLLSAASFQKDWHAAAVASGVSDTVTVTSVAPGSAGDRAGVQVGDRLLQVNGAAVPTGANGVRQASERLAKGGHGPDTAATLVLRRDTATMTVAVPFDSACAFPLHVVQSGELNAFADGQNVYVTTAMMRFADDRDLRTVVAHEIGHNTMHHMDAKRRNSMLGALAGAVLDVASASAGVNTGGQYTAQFANLGGATFSRSFENEADYVGVYILALNGDSLTDVATLWRRLGAENPGSIKFASTHPTSPERYVRLTNTVAEIKAKLAAGTPLRPEMQGR